MITICWAAKGGSGTTVVAATRAIHSPDPTLLVDLAGDLPATLGITDPDGPGVSDWLDSNAPTERLRSLELEVRGACSLLPAGTSPAPAAGRWTDLAEHLCRERRDVIVDAGTGVPPAALMAAADHAWLVTRACYISLRAAIRQSCRPTGVVHVAEPGRALDVDDIEVTLGAPVVANVLLDPAVARAVDAGLLVSRLPGRFRQRIGAAG